MFSRLSYIGRETWANLRRNLTLTIAALLTIAVTLTLVGVWLLAQKAVSNTTERWKGGVEFIVFMKADAAQEQIDAVGRDLRANPQVQADKLRFVDKQAAYEEFKRLYPDTPELVNTLTPDMMPTSYRVVPKTDDATVIDGIGSQFQKKAGVQDVVYAKQAVEWIYTVSNFLRWVFVAVALALGLGSVILIWNTIRTAMFARRREIEVMKLVGATNWFIRIPFMVEGLIQGLVGAILACLFVWGANSFWTSNVVNKINVVDLQQLQVSSGQLRLTCLILLLVGMFVGTLGSGIAVTRFLDV
jgi:cell division transport system permease protein